ETGEQGQEREDHDRPRDRPRRLGRAVAMVIMRIVWVAGTMSTGKSSGTGSDTDECMVVGVHLGGGVVFVVVFAGGSTARLAEAGTIGRTRVIGGRRRRAADSDDPAHRVVIVAGIVDYLAFRPEAGEEGHTAQRGGRQHPAGECQWHVLAEAAHVLL